MIQQTNLNSASTVSDQHPVTTPSAEPRGRWQGLAIRSAIELVRSFNPFYYFPPNAQTSLLNAAGSAGIDFPGLDDQTSHSLQFTSLAGRAIAA
ncbi:hypothetical protein [Endozoicomonas sp. ONNA2]|uniref:hypothetical protein n=1 Tax=Endozoicomonas sp. ONNA2 TaxID=2828741 RepID=UPI0021491990|nr:hypothetical protein [Endozoicomonas sp. ONNA2]